MVMNEIIGFIGIMRIRNEPSPAQKELNSLFYRELCKGLGAGAIVGSSIPLIKSIRNPPSTRKEIFRVLRASALKSPRFALPFAAFSAGGIDIPEDEISYFPEVTVPYVPENGTRRFLFSASLGYCGGAFAGSSYSLIKGLWNPMQRRNMLAAMCNKGIGFGIAGALFTGSVSAYVEGLAIASYLQSMEINRFSTPTPTPTPVQITKTMNDDETHIDTAKILA